MGSLRTTFIRKAKSIKGLDLHEKMAGIAKLKGVRDEVDSWYSLFYGEIKICSTSLIFLNHAGDRPVSTSNNHQGEPKLEKKETHLVLLYIALICRLELLRQNFDASCTVHDVRQNSAT
jgi:hypothetical protein